MLINNHTNIDNDIIAIEAVVPQINHLRNSLYDIHSIEGYKQLRGELSQMLFDIESEIRKAVDNMKVIQHNNRQFYDSYAELENNFDEFNARTKQMSAENAHLISKLEDANKHIEYLTHITMNQESYINELIEKLSTREKDVYGCQVTKKKDFFMNSNNNNNNNNNNVNSSRLSGDGTMLLNTNKILNFNYDSNSFQDNLNESNNNNGNKGGCSSSGNNCNGNGNELPITKVMVPDKENNDVDFIYKLYQEEKKKQRDEQLNKKENSNVHIEEKEEPKKSKIDRIQEIVLKGFNDEIILSKLKAHFGDNFEERIINEEVSDEYLHEVEKKIIEYSTNTDEQCDNTINTANNTNINQFPEKEQLPELDTYLRSKDKETISKRKNNIDNSESYSTLKNYFLFNLKRDLMLSRGKKQ